MKKVFFGILFLLSTSSVNAVTLKNTTHYKVQSHILSHASSHASHHIDEWQKLRPQEETDVDLRGALDDIKQDIGNTNEVITLHFTGYASHDKHINYDCLPELRITKDTNIKNVNTVIVIYNDDNCVVKK